MMIDKKEPESRETKPSFRVAPVSKVLNSGKILVVDDEKFNCDIIEGFLMILGF
jgi:hypothetical protein